MADTHSIDDKVGGHDSHSTGSDTQDKMLEVAQDLEHKVKHFGGKAWAGAKVAATTAGAFALNPWGTIARHAGFFTGDYLFNRKELKEDLGARIAKTAHQANISTALLTGSYAITNSILNPIGKGLVGAALIAPFNMLYLPFQYIYQKNILLENFLNR